jgi:DNA-binding response OmpR family regulator
MEAAIMDKGLKVLLVDDNPVIRELLLARLSIEASVISFSNAPDALRRAEKQTPDLIISDYRMPGLSGLELLGQLRIAFPQVAVIMMASRADITGPLAGTSLLVEEFIEKPFFIDEAVGRIKRVLDRVSLGKATREGANSTSVRGTLAQMSVVDLLQTLDMGRKSCSLVLTHGAEQSEMQFHDGQLVHATLGKLTGETVVYKVAAWAEGSFQIDFERVECPRTITHTTQSVLLEALRLYDEAQRDGDMEDGSAKPNGSAGVENAPATAVGF